MKKNDVIFGPLMTRRLGLSLGIDLVPAKTCNMNCIYCECGATTCFTNKEISIITPEIIQEELHAKKHLLIDTDYITLTASGEPTLNPFIDDIIAVIRTITDKPIALITNASLLNRNEVREKIKTIEVSLPSLDSAVKSTFRKINKPHRDLKIDTIIEGIKELCELGKPAVWLEIMLVKDINDNEKEMHALKEAVHYIKPHRVQINTPVRPGTSAKALPLMYEELIWLSNQLDYLYEIVSYAKRGSSVSSVSSHKIRADEIAFVFNMLKRRPMTVNHLKHSSKLDFQQLYPIIEHLLSTSSIQKIIKGNETYYFKNQ